MAHRILLVRHGRSAHVQSEWMDLAGFARWREAYDAAGIQDEPPADVKALAAGAGAIVASTSPRAMQSASLLGREITASPLLLEIEPVPPAIPFIRLPLAGWALAYGVRWLIRAALRRPHVTPAEQQRAVQASAWLARLAERHGTVLAVTHASFRGHVVRQLIAMGWRSEIPRARTRHWSVWSLCHPEHREGSRGAGDGVVVPRDSSLRSE